MHNAMTPGDDNYGPSGAYHQEHQHWVGVVVHLPGSGSGPPGQQPVGVVHSISHDGQLVVLPGAWAASGAEFVEQAGAAAQLCSPHDVLLQLYKTRLCSFGRKCNRPICFFAHDAAELRTTCEEDT
ncbi:C3H1-type domain-containing protein [Haematococcus lacustris]|uniref:C3H1-type domain-containing protein n=1 Tax=Haematococcus lacustris TaxID=44745 RepID=A0A699YW66_HAELA|nr:C3H1-type domain-containing protein [Haematococcus lacustris]